MNKRYISLLFLILTIVMSSLMFERIVSHMGHSIKDLPIPIISLKTRTQHVEIMGANEYLNSSNTLSHNRINLNMWHGNQHLEFPSMENKSFFFHYRLDQNGILDLTFREKMNNGHTSIRLIENGRSKIVTVTNKGKFLNEKELQVEVKRKGLVEIINKSIYINKKEVLTLPFNPIVGVRGNGITPSSISNLYLNNKRISLSPRYSITYILTFIVLLSLVLFFFDGFAKMTASLLIMFCLIVSYFSFIHFFQALYPTSFWGTDEGKEQFINTEKNRLEKSISTEIHPVIFIGSSQTFGEGASSQSMRWTELYCKKSKKKNCLNLGIRSATSQIFINLSNEILKMRPEKIFYILSHNDIDSQIHKKNTETLFKIWKEKAIPVVVVIEPDIHSLKELSQNNYNLMNLATRYSFKIVNPINELKRKANSGWIWWDEIHLTDYGHQLFSDYLFQELGNL